MAEFKAIIAVDPGASGGIAFYLKGDAVVREHLEVYAMPETGQDLVDRLKDFVRYCREWKLDPTVYVERVGGFTGGPAPGSAMFNFGWWASGPVWIAQTLGLRVVMVTPQKWQKKLSLGHGGKGDAERRKWKNKLKAEAQRRRPELGATLKTADAILILEYALLTEK